MPREQAADAAGDEPLRRMGARIASDDDETPQRRYDSGRA